MSAFENELAFRCKRSCANPHILDFHPRLVIIVFSAGYRRTFVPVNSI